MVTKLSDGRGQVTLKGHVVNDEWEALVKGAASRNGQTTADFVVSTTTAAAQAILKGESAVPAALPARPEDVVGQLDQLLERFQERIDEANRQAQEREEELARRQEEQTRQVAAELQEKTTRELDRFRDSLAQKMRLGRWRR